jgi:cytidylate kinase
VHRGRGVVTISASYGAGGSEIGPAVAAALDLQFIDRAIPANVARKLAIPLAEAESKDEAVDTGLWRVMSSMALVPDLAGAGPLAYHTFSDERAFRTKTEEVLREIAAERGGVILGRAAAIVLADVPKALHVRLDAPEDARVAALRERTGEDEETIRQQLRTNDAARAAYVRHFYRQDPRDCTLYHIVIDSTVIGWEATADLIVAAARVRGVGS